MNLEELREDIADELTEVTDLRVYARVPDSIPGGPCAILTLAAGVPIDFDGGERVIVNLFLLESRDDRGQGRLDALLASTKDAVQSMTSLRWAGWEGYGATYTFNDVTYVGVQVNLEVMG
jgi:hypothetical protein